jgi:hypothetical protein
LHRGPWRAVTTTFGLDCNPLRRRSDRIEVAALFTAVLLCPGIAPLAALVGIMVCGELLNLAERQARTRLPVVGIVLDQPGSADRGAAYPSRRALVAWTTADGLESSGTVTVPRDAGSGSHVTVWTTSQGVPTHPPLTPSQVTADAAAVAVSVVGSAMGFVRLAWRVVRRSLDRRRYRAWESEWVEIGNSPTLRVLDRGATLGQHRGCGQPRDELRQPIADRPCDTARGAARRQGEAPDLQLSVASARCCLEGLEKWSPA